MGRKIIFEEGRTVTLVLSRAMLDRIEAVADSELVRRADAMRMVLGAGLDAIEKPLERPTGAKAR